MSKSVSKTTLDLLTILNDLECHSGTQLAKLLGISRNAVWKIIKKLKDYNLPITSDIKGYQLKEELFLFDEEILNKLLGDQFDLDLFESLDSTNSYLMRNLNKKSQKAQLCIAEVQTSGRGRMGRQWISPFAQNLTFSLSYTFTADVSSLSGLSLVVGLAIAEAISTLSPSLEPKVKWPNDIYLKGQKSAGTLIEISAEANGHSTAVIGIGVNVNMKKSQIDKVHEKIDQEWTSLYEHLQTPTERHVLLSLILGRIMAYMPIFNNQGLSAFMELWSSYDYLLNQPVKLVQGHEIISGISRGIDNRGMLLLQLDASSPTSLKPFSFGDTQLLKN